MARTMARPSRMALAATVVVLEALAPTGAGEARNAMLELTSVSIVPLSF